jgi:hypothetical protein
MYRKVNVKRWVAEHDVELAVCSVTAFFVLLFVALIVSAWMNSYHMGGCYGVGCP